MPRAGIGTRRGSPASPLLPSTRSSSSLRVRSRENGVSARSRVAEIQRLRLLGAAVAVVEELGWSHATVADVTSRARVSRRTFYDLFENREDCLLAVMQDTVERIEDGLVAADLEGLPWRERVRAGLWMILCFVAREPVLARICVVQSARGGQRVLERREEILERLSMVLDEGRLQGPRAAEVSVLVAEGLAGAALTILHKRLLRDESEPLGDLLGELMSMIVLPYLGPGVARRERTRPVPPVPVWRESSLVVDGVGEGDPLLGVSMRLTYRTARVLQVIAEHPGVSNRTVAEHAGVTDQGQISKLLARLERFGLTENTGDGHAKGEPNVWRLTTKGSQLEQSIRIGDHRRVAA
jgi:AcrR family transcriptional regulator